MEKKALNEKAVLVHFSSSFLGTTRLDKNVSQEVEENHKADKPGRYFKRIFKREDLKEVLRTMGAAKNLHLKYSLPWFDGGVRIMPVTLLEKYLKENSTITKEYEKAVNQFIDNYDDIMTSNKLRLNDLFKTEDYPTKEEAKNAFAIRIGYMPLPGKDDFRITAPESVVSGMKKKYDEQLKESESRSKEEVAERLESAVRNLLDKLSRDDKNIRESAFTRISPLIDTLRSLNMTGDTKIEALLKETENSFSKETADVVNENSALRKQKKDEAKSILEKVETLKRSLTF